MKRDTFWLIVAIIMLLGVVGGLVWIFSGSQDIDPEISDDSVVVDDSDQDQENIVVEFEDVEDDSGIEYSVRDQSTGEVVGESSVLKSVDIKKDEDIVEISFQIDSEESDSVKISVSNDTALGVLDIRIDGVSAYEGSLDYGDSLDINYNGITSLRKVIEGVDLQERFALGCSSEVEFSLLDISDGLVRVLVKYPGGEISDEEVGSTEFTTDDLSYEGNDKNGGAKIIDYDYIYNNGSLKFNLQVSSDSGITIPSFESSLSDGVLTVTFPSLYSDSVYKWDDTLELPRGVNLIISRDGDSSVYEFTGGFTQYRVFGESNPNQVVIDMDL